MFNNCSRWAQVCPFVRDALDYDLFWIAQSPLVEQAGIEKLLLEQKAQFIATPPVHDPLAVGPAKLPTLWKIFTTFFPEIKHRGKSAGPLKMFDDLHLKLRTTFRSAGLMLGQFYPNCPEEGLHNKAFRSLVSP